MKNENFTVDEFNRFSELIYEKTGIRFEMKKMYFIGKRVQKRIDEVGADSVSEYIRLLKFIDKDGKELQNLMNLLTVNETYFFRDFPQLTAFAEDSLIELTDKKRKQDDRTLRIWSAGCSSGEEPYTLAIILLEMVDDIKYWDVDIVATDIDDPVIEKAKRAVYSNRSIKDVPPDYLERYFTRKGFDNYQLKDIIKNMITFEHLNLSDSALMRKKKNFDFIFCRNVLIYFDDLSRKKVVDHFYLALNKGGYIFLGSSESAGRINSAFKIKRMTNYLVYYK